MAKQQKNDILSHAIGQRLRQLRETHKLSQEQVLFLHNIYLTRLETGRTCISICTLIKLCETYGISLAEFFNGLNYVSSSSKE